jgi:NAD(P)-dependent dehydrogenase (short-subunit alcohol dehydrogenase family)
MSGKKVWFITGAGRGMGFDFATAPLAAGDAVVATGRNPDAMAKALGEADDLLLVKLDVTSRADAEAAVGAPPSSASAASTCWSTTPPTFVRATSRS